MPYVNLEGVIALDVLEDSFDPQPDASVAVVKYGTRFISVAGDEWIIDTVAVEKGSGGSRGSQHFYIRLKQTESRLSIRLDPMTDPFKSPGVHEAIAALGRWVLKEASGSRVAKHGLGEQFIATLL